MKNKNFLSMSLKPQQRSKTYTAMDFQTSLIILLNTVRFLSQKLSAGHQNIWSTNGRTRKRVSEADCKILLDNAHSFTAELFSLRTWWCWGVWSPRGTPTSLDYRYILKEHPLSAVLALRFFLFFSHKMQKKKKKKKKKCYNQI